MSPEVRLRNEWEAIFGNTIIASKFVLNRATFLLALDQNLSE